MWCMLFFKQKTAYYMRIMYWSSDVCSSDLAGQQAISPQRLAHFVLRTSRFEELVDWYQTVLGATPAFKNELLAFLSYDEEHHRVAILKIGRASCRDRVCQ